MSDETIVAIYDTPAHANLAVADLKAAGVPESAISVHAGAGATTTTTSTTTPVREEGFWASLFGGHPDRDTAVYDRSLDSGSTVVTVKTPETHITKVMEILESHNPVDIDDRATSYGLTGATTSMTTGTATSMTRPIAPTTNTTAGLATGKSESLQLSEENLAVGKRLVNRGGTRIHRYVVETPVEESVSLHSETVTLERNPVTDGRPTADSFSDKTIEMTESAEEAVVSKTARVYEEVGLRKEATDRTETVRDTVRKEEVKVEQVPGTTTTTTGGTLPLGASKP